MSNSAVHHFVQLSIVKVTKRTKSTRSHWCYLCLSWLFAVAVAVVFLLFAHSNYIASILDFIHSPTNWHLSIHPDTLRQTRFGLFITSQFESILSRGYGRTYYVNSNMPATRSNKWTANVEHTHTDTNQMCYFALKAYSLLPMAINDAYTQMLLCNLIRAIVLMRALPWIHTNGVCAF